MGKNASKFDEELIKNYDENSDKGYVLEGTINYLRVLHNLHSNLSFFLARKDEN